MEPSIELYIQLLGTFKVWTTFQAILAANVRQKAASLVKLLALAPEHCLHHERVLEELWPEVPEKAAMNNLHRTLHDARRALSTSSNSYLRFRGDLLVLAPAERLWTDVDAFVAEAVKARRSQEVEDYEAALAHYKGDLLPEDHYQDWTSARREELYSLHLDLLMELAQLHEGREDHPAALGAFRKVLEREPALEAAHLGIMRAYLMLGQRHSALRQYGRLHEALRRELDAEPDEESRRLYEQILAGDPKVRIKVRPSPSGLPPTNLTPALTSFIGREAELAQLESLLGTTRLLTLKGTIGCGKSRLALELAFRKRRAYRDGVWWVDLADCAEASCIPEAIAQALDIETPSLDGLKAYLKDKELLLILDNCVHLLEACAKVAVTLLRGCQGLRLLATSREALQLESEVNWRLSPLRVPQGDRLERLEDYEAVRLFVERARLYRPAFALTPERTPAVINICRHLEGLPLAIELLVSKLGVLSTGQIAARLDDLLPLLRNANRSVTPRHRSFEEALDGSYNLLSQEEQALFRQLAVFAGGFSLEAAESVCAAGLEVLELLSSLIDKSLVMVEPTERRLRYRLLEPIRQYAARKLAGEELERLRDKHLDLALAEAGTEPSSTTSHWERLEREQGNFQAALQWALEKEHLEKGLGLAVALAPYWQALGQPGEGNRWLEKFLARAHEVEPDLAEEARRWLNELSKAE
ncbi:MAG: NB-ARC domain-containing protein [Deinococcota bacterium]|nr:NB-ARC domain-containing protein [Deinococcota bacterium]